MTRPKISAHRGGPADEFAPNSLDAITSSLELGVDLVEFDVRVTADGRFVAYHRDSVVVDGLSRPIREISEAEALANAPDAARVEDVLRLIRGRAMGHVDLKEAHSEIEIADLCAAELGEDGFVLTTLEDTSVRRLRHARPRLQAGLALGRGPTGLGGLALAKLLRSEIFPGSRVRACGASFLAINYYIARLGALRWARANDVPVLLWTVNNPRVLRSAVNDERYWAVTTDYPKLALTSRAGSGTG